MRNRSAIELMVLGFAFVVGLAIVGLSAAVVIIEIREPETDTGLLSATLVGLVSNILGMLLGLIAGRTDTGGDLHRRPGGDDNGIVSGD